MTGRTTTRHRRCGFAPGTRCTARISASVRWQRRDQLPRVRAAAGGAGPRTCTPPFAAAAQPPPIDPAFYATLAQLHLPERTAFAAGFAHESQSLPEQLVVRTLIEDQLGRAVDISPAGGLGRRTPAAGVAVLERTAELLPD